MYRCDVPNYNYPDMIKYHETEPESFTKLQHTYVYFTPGNFMKQIFPDNSVSIQYLSHVLSAFPSKQGASDHIFASLSNDEAIRQQRTLDGYRDLENCLRIKQAELIPSGRLYFDLMGLLPENNVFNFINEVIKEASQQNIIPRKVSNMFIRTHFRSKSEIDTVIDSLQDIYKLVSYKETYVKMPHFEEFEQDRDIEKYAEGVILFWKKIYEIYMGQLLASEFSKDQIQIFISNLVNFTRQKVIEQRPISAAFSHYVVLEKKI